MSMDLKKNIKNKQGSYIAEAALTLPVFIICVVAMVLVVRIIAVCENIGFVSAKKMRETALAAYSVSEIKDKYEITASLCKLNIHHAIRKENSRLTNFKIKNFDYLYTDSSIDIDDLIALDTVAKFNVINPIGVKGKIIFSQGILARACTGTIRPYKPMGEEDFNDGKKSETVWVFIKYGKRFHKPACRYVKQEYKGEEKKLEMDKQDALRKGYTSCLVCGGEKNGQLDGS